MYTSLAAAVLLVEAYIAGSFGVGIGLVAEYTELDLGIPGVDLRDLFACLLVPCATLVTRLLAFECLLIAEARTTLA